MAFILYLLRLYQYASLDSLPTFSAEDSIRTMKYMFKDASSYSHARPQGADKDE